MSNYKSCDYTPTSDTIAHDEEIEQMSIEPSLYYACTPYGNAASIEDLAAQSVASNTAQAAASGADEAAGPAVIPWLPSPEMLHDDEECHKANEEDDRYWMKQVQRVGNPLKQPSIPLKLLQWLLHPSVAC